MARSRTSGENRLGRPIDPILPRNEVSENPGTLHRASDFVAFLSAIDTSVDPAQAIHVVLDNLATHKAPVVHRWLLRHPRVHLHFTPTYASWLNLVERFFGLLTAKALKRGSHTSLPQLRTAILAFVDAHNARRAPFIWTKTADDILDKMRRFGLRTQQVLGA